MSNPIESITNGIRTFRLMGAEIVGDASSGTAVAEGVEFTDGTCVLSWLTAPGSKGFYQNIKSLQAIPGYYGRASVVFDNPPAPPHVEPSRPVE